MRSGIDVGRAYAERSRIDVDRAYVEREEIDVGKSLRRTGGGDSLRPQGFYRIGACRSEGLNSDGS